MAELTQQALLNGQEVQTGDINNLGLGALMDDRVLAEILRMLPNTGTVSKLIMPYGADNDPFDSTVFTNQTADAKVYIGPFRAVVGSRTVVGTDALKAWRDIRSGVCVAGKGIWSASPPTSLSVAQVIAANSSGNARWDALYAIVTPDTSQTAVARAVKSPTTGAVTTPNTVVQLACTVSIGYAQGTPAASPVVPAIPVDAGGNYYIALAYVLVPNGFSATSVVMPWMIMPATPAPIALSKGIGGVNMTPANQQNVPGGQIVQSTSEASWANNSTTSISARPNTFIPPDMIGAEMLFGAIDLTGASSAAWSHQSGTNVDTSRDWRNRFFIVFWQAGLPTTGGGGFAWDRAAGTTKPIPAWDPTQTVAHAMATYSFFGFGQSFTNDASSLPGSPPANSSVVSMIDATKLIENGSPCVALYVDQNDSGKLKIYIDGTAANCTLFFFIVASRPYANH